MDSIEIINKIESFDVKEFKDDFKKILKQTKKILKIDTKLSLSLTICNDEYIQELNREYRGINKETDVLSFAIEDDSDEEDLSYMIEVMGIREIGDIIINLNRVYSQAESYGHSIRREICFLFTHGLLHLLGYDHMEKEEEEEMFGLQETILDSVGIKR